jgi:EAL domain-containing protein (putative c-di-GMP-specific phosphodiesterase class I)
MFQYKHFALASLILIIMSWIGLPDLNQYVKLISAAAILIIQTLLIAIYNKRDARNSLKKRINSHYRNKQITDYFCLALEYRNSGKYQNIFDNNFDVNFHYEFFTKLKKRFGRNYVHKWDRNQIIICTSFSNPNMGFDEKQDEQLTVTREVSKYFRNLLKTMPIDNKYYIKLTIGTASQGVKREINQILDLIELAQYTKLMAYEENIGCKIADETTRAMKSDVDDFVTTMEESFILDEFNPFFQPIINLEGNYIVGCESFVRWQKNSYRIIEARKFKDIANEKNLIKNIDMRVINKTFRFIWKLRSEILIPDNFMVYINISAHTLKEIQISQLADLASMYGLSPDLIEFDIKDITLTDPPVTKYISEIKKLGFRVSLDVFHADTLALKAFLYNDFDSIKIDKSIFSKENICEREFMLYKSIVKIAHAMKLKKIVKGVENKAHLEVARKLKVDYVQGYYFTPPLDEQKFTEYLLKYKDGIYV